MKLNLFSIPVYICNVDLEKIKIENKDVEKTWLSETPSSFNFENNLSQESSSYILGKIANLLKKDFNFAFNITLQNIWQNFYKNNDYQEKHNHPGSHFSFIIYKDIKESQTVLFNPCENLIESYYKDFKDIGHAIDYYYQPECTQGQMLLFPSFLIHMVKKNNNSSTIAGNIVIKKN